MYCLPIVVVVYLLAPQPPYYSCNVSGEVTMNDAVKSRFPLSIWSKWFCKGSKMFRHEQDTYILRYCSYYIIFNFADDVHVCLSIWHTDCLKAYHILATVVRRVSYYANKGLCGMAYTWANGMWFIANDIDLKRQLAHGGIVVIAYHFRSQTSVTDTTHQVMFKLVR